MVRQERTISEAAGSPAPLFPGVEGYLSFLPSEAQRLLADFMTTDDFLHAVNVTGSFSPRSAEDHSEFIKCLRGFLFESVSYQLLQRDLKSEGQLLLSPRETFEIYAILYPERKKFDDYSLQQGIDGITVPDGVILQASNRGDTTHIVGVVEYTLDLPKHDKDLRLAWRWMSKAVVPLFDTTSASLVVGDYLKSRYPQLPLSRKFFLNRNAFQVICVIPRGARVPFAEVGVQFAPISGEELGNFVNLFIYDIRCRTQEDGELTKTP